MPSLNDQQLADLLEEVGAAIENSIPVGSALGRVAKQRFGKTSRAAQKLVTSTEQGASLAASFEKLHLSDEDQITAAIQAAERTGNPELLDRLAQALRERHEAKQTSRLNWFYPCILTVLAYVLFVKTWAPLVRNNQTLITQWPEFVVSISFWIVDGWWIPPCVVAAMLVGAILILPRRRGFPSTWNQSLFYTTLASQLDSNVPESDAIHTAAMMGEETELLGIKDPSFTTPRIVQLLGPQSNLFTVQAHEIDEAARAKATDFDPTDVSSISKRAQLRHLAYSYEQKARRREKLLNIVLPQLVSFTFGCVFILLAAALFIAPIYGQLLAW